MHSEDYAHQDILRAQFKLQGVEIKKIFSNRYFYLSIAISLIFLLYLSSTNNTKYNSIDNYNPQIPDPSITYCKGLGYKDIIITHEDGSQSGICKISLFVECNSWEFFNGKCAKEYTLCEEQGGKIISIRDKRCRFTPKCAICIKHGVNCTEWDNFRGVC